MTAGRIGVLGGSFNPLHQGHLQVAHRCRDIFGLSKVLFVVAAAPPHKPAGDLISFVHRYAMVSLATAAIPYFVPSMAEMDPPASPYSIDTLAKLARAHDLGGEDLFFIAGGDSFAEVAGWHESSRLLSSYNFIFVTRPGVAPSDITSTLPPAVLPSVVDCRGTDAPELRRGVLENDAAPSRRIYLADVGAPDIAASQIRRRVGSKQPIDSLVPAAVVDYISKLHLYGD